MERELGSRAYLSCAETFCELEVLPIFALRGLEIAEQKACWWPRQQIAGRGGSRLADDG